MTKEKKIITILIVLLICALAVSSFLLLKRDTKTAVIEKTEQQLNDAEKTGQIRIKINSTIQVEGDTMQDIDFYNVNDNRLLKCKIKLKANDECVYESEFVNPGEYIKADILNSDIKAGTHEAIAEFYSYSVDSKKKIGQVNAEIVLVK